MIQKADILDIFQSKYYMNNIFGSVVQQKGFLLENLLQTRVTISIQAKLFETLAILLHEVVR